MSTHLFPLASKKNSDKQRIIALNSSWIRRLYPTSQDHSIPINLKSHSPLHFMPEIPLLPQANLVTGFGPFQVQPKLRPLRPSADDCADELVGKSDPSQFPVHCAAKLVRIRKGSSSSDGAGELSAASKNFYNPLAFNLNNSQHLRERKNYCSPREPEKPFSYWNMGRLERTNFVSSVCPSTASTMIHTKKRSANRYGFISSKFRRFYDED